jgi:hypothetical protein
VSATTVDVLAVGGLVILGMNDSILRPSMRKSSPTARGLLAGPRAARPHAAEIGESCATWTQDRTPVCRVIRQCAG